jgi:hypothetical protein
VTIALLGQRGEGNRTSGFSDVVGGAVEQSHRRSGVLVADLDDPIGSGVDDLHCHRVRHPYRDAVDKGRRLCGAHGRPGRERASVGRCALRHHSHDRGAQPEQVSHGDQPADP